MSQGLLEDLVKKMKKKGLKLATAESCTGGLLAVLITRISGASGVFDRGFVSYSDVSKIEELGVSAAVIEKHGSVSAYAVGSMASGALENSHANIALAITGIAGPTGGTKEKPIGLVYLGCAVEGGPSKVIEENFTGSREDIQSKAALSAVQMLLEVVDGQD